MLDAKLMMHAAESRQLLKSEAGTHTLLAVDR